MGLARLLTGRLGTDECQLTLEEAISAVGAVEGVETYGGIRLKRTYLADDGRWITFEDKSRLTPQKAADFLEGLFTPNDGRAALSYAYGNHRVDRHDSAHFHHVEIGISWGEGLAEGNGIVSEKVIIHYIIPT